MKKTGIYTNVACPKWCKTYCVIIPLIKTCRFLWFSHEKQNASKDHLSHIFFSMLTLSQSNLTYLPLSGWYITVEFKILYRVAQKKLDHFWALVTFSSNELEMCIMCHFVAKIVKKRLVTDHKLTFDAVVKYSLQMQRRRLWRYFCLQTWLL